MTAAAGTTKSPKGPGSRQSPTIAPVNGNAEDQEEAKKEKVKEIPVFQDTGFFVFDTGDTYDGSFEIKKKDLSIKMHGPGVYTTAEGDTYTAHWDTNVIDYKEPTIVSYNDGANFEGILRGWCYNGKGIYKYPDTSVLTCEFSENCPVGNLVLTDPNGHIWLGKADQGFAWCSPVNHFYDMLETTIYRAKRRHRHVSASEGTTSGPKRDSRKTKESPKPKKK